MRGSSSQPNTEQPMSPIHTFPIEDMYFQHTVHFKKPLVSENSRLGNTRKDAGFWIEVLQYMESKTRMYGRRTYDMVNVKWKMVRPIVVRFCEVYNNVMRKLKESGAGDGDYFNRALLDYEAETECSDKRYKTYGSSSFNTEGVEVSINLNVDVDDDDGDKVKEIRRPIGRDKAKGTMKKKGRDHRDRQIKMREVEFRERELTNQEYRQRQEDIRFYLQPYDHLIGDARTTMEALRAEIKAKYNLPY
ncbi:hypothetical protein Tco_1264726 [Tanacetum coccineum]